MDIHDDTRPGPGPGDEQGADHSGVFSPFGSSWNAPPTASLANSQIQVASSFMGMSTPSSELARFDEPLSAMSRTEEDDTLHIEKSRVLDQLQHMTAEVERLESRLQALKR